MVQWLRVCLPMQGTWVPSLVGELRSHMLWAAKAPPSTTTEPARSGGLETQRNPSVCNEDPIHRN